MSQPQIKLHKLPDTKPTKHTISVMPINAALFHREDGADLVWSRPKTQ